MTTSARGGFGFGHQHRGSNYGRQFGAPNPGRTYGPQPGARAQHQRFYLDGSGHGVLEAGDTLTVTLDDEGNTVVSVTGADDGADNGDMVEEAADENGNGDIGNGEEEESERRRFFGRRDKMRVSTNPDGSVLIRPDSDNTLQIVGDSESGAVTVVEIEPETLNVADGRY